MTRRVIIEAYTYSSSSSEPEETLDLTVGDTFEDHSDQWSWFKIAAITDDGDGKAH